MTYVVEELGRVRHAELLADAERRRVAGSVARAVREQRRADRRAAVREALWLGRASLAAFRRTLAV
ncbi:hypothetical protein CLV35_3518 [Motilibacter peucedani]|uniref:Uncharacterized protein n=1 Tax=Motilibacter peucedani TaxID=598650 RepID=A0A420XL08_9ACTN|nr:hypothetical protein [Motilibacter peucedani]RKS69341.1 hypothetical protein CLV35_3518 [Motilibacter peucedani]